MAIASDIATQIYSYSGIPFLREYLRGRSRTEAVFIWIPRTAGTSVYSCLNAPKLKNLCKVTYHFAGNGIVTFGHMDYAQLVEAGYIPTRFDESAYKFAFVRNPYDRAVSLYFWMKRRRRPSARGSFLTFCRRLIQDGCEPIGLYNVAGLSQCNPQVRWVENVRMDFIGRLESIRPDVQAVLADLGLQDVPLPKLNRTNHADYRQYYCTESKQIVEDFYREDFYAFDYQFEPFLA